MPHDDAKLDIDPNLIDSEAELECHGKIFRDKLIMPHDKPAPYLALRAAQSERSCDYVKSQEGKHPVLTLFDQNAPDVVEDPGHDKEADQNRHVLVYHDRSYLILRKMSL